MKTSNTKREAERNIEIIQTNVSEYPLERKMREKKLSIRGLAKKSGVDYTFISKLLSGKARCSPLIADKLRTALDDHNVPRALPHKKKKK